MTRKLFKTFIFLLGATLPCIGRPPILLAQDKDAHGDHEHEGLHFSHPLLNESPSPDTLHNPAGAEAERELAFVGSGLYPVSRLAELLEELETVHPLGSDEPATTRIAPGVKIFPFTTPGSGCCELQATRRREQHFRHRHRRVRRRAPGEGDYGSPGEGRKTAECQPLHSSVPRPARRSSRSRRATAARTHASSTSDTGLIMSYKRIVPAAVLTALLAATATAQDSSTASRGKRLLRDAARRSSVDLTVSQARPQGELARNIGLGYGVSGAYVFRLDADGIWSLRADVAALAYGNEMKRSAFSETVGGRVQVHTRTTNYIVPVFVGPQLAWPTGAVRPFVHAGIGAQTFVTESSVQGRFDQLDLASSVNLSDATLVWVTGGGVHIPLTRRSTRAQLDVSAQYLGGGRARYLAPGGITDVPGGAIHIAPFESRTHYVMLRLGARFGL
jgi:outer membrane protein W